MANLCLAHAAIGPENEETRHLVSTGEAVTILSDVVYRPWTLDGRRIEKVDVAAEIPTMDVCMAWLDQRMATPAMTAFRQHFAAAFSGASRE